MTRTVSTYDSLDYITNLLSSMKPDPECKNTDARAVILIRSESRTVTIGGNCACLLYKGKTYETPAEVSRLIWGRNNKDLEMILKAAKE
jgi:hypothetical protein